MNNKSLILIPILFQISFAYCQTTTKEFPVLKGPYLGQTPPGTTPVVFAPGIVSTGLYTRDITITNDGKEIYFCISDPFITGIFVTKQVDGTWTEPVIAPFSGKEFLDIEPHISPDGKKFFFLSNRPPPGKVPKPGWFYQKLWFMDKTISGWSEPKLVEEPVNSDENEFFPSTTNENVLYFTRSGKSGKQGFTDQFSKWQISGTCNAALQHSGNRNAVQCLYITKRRFPDYMRTGHRLN